MEVEHKLHEGMFFGSLDAKHYISHSQGMLLMTTMLLLPWVLSCDVFDYFTLICFP